MTQQDTSQGSAERGEGNPYRQSPPPGQEGRSLADAHNNPSRLPPGEEISSPESRFSEERQRQPFSRGEEGSWPAESRPYEGPRETHGFNQTNISQTPFRRTEFLSGSSYPRGGYPQADYSREDRQRDRENQPGQQEERDIRPYQAGGGAPQQYGDYSREAQPFEEQGRFQNQFSNQNQTKMDRENRNYEDEYTYRNPRFEQDVRRAEEREYGSRRGMSGQYYDRDYDRGGFKGEQEAGRGGYGQRDYDREAMERSSRNYYRDRDQERFERSSGPFHTTESDRPGRGYENEREMNRRANSFGRENRYRGREGERRYGEGNRGYQQEPYYNAASSHSATGPYEDYERDAERFGIRQDYRDGRPAYNPAEYDRERRAEEEGYRSQNRSFYYRPGEEAERRRRFSNRIQDRGLERSPGGNWGPSESEYNRRRYEGYEGGGERY